jgi:hypothetical protein
MIDQMFVVRCAALQRFVVHSEINLGSFGMFLPCVDNVQAHSVEN